MRGTVREKRHKIDGIIVTLPNFGDDKGVAIAEAIGNYLGWERYRHE